MVYAHKVTPRSCFREKPRAQSSYGHMNGLTRYGSCVSMCVLRLYCLANVLSQDGHANLLLWPSLESMSSRMLGGELVG